MKIISEEATIPLNTEGLFSEVAHTDVGNDSPIDEFISSIIKINNTCTSPREMSPELGNLMILGYVSAFESYLRSLIREVVNVDEPSYLTCQRQSVSFAAALNHSHQLMPEAMLENTSFTSYRTISEALNTFMGFKKNSTETAVKGFVEEYQKVCQLRHCIVHRFGKLGSQNAISLGFSNHKKYLESRITPDYATTQLVARICDDTARSINNFCYEKLIKRTHEEAWIDWTSDLRKDKRYFKRYYDVFASTQNIPRSPSLQRSYKEFRDKILLSYN